MGKFSSNPGWSFPLESREQEHFGSSISIAWQRCDLPRMGTPHLSVFSSPLGPLPVKLMSLQTYFTPYKRYTPWGHRPFSPVGRGLPQYLLFHGEGQIWM